MSIETGQNLEFDANYPKPHQNQSTQQFRDNFAIIKNSIEQLQIAKSDPLVSSVLDLSMTQNAVTGAMRLNASYRHNALILPHEDPTGGIALEPGMIRFKEDSAAVEYFDGDNWRSLVSSGRAADAAAMVTLASLTVNTKLTLNATPVDPTDVVPLGYLDQRIATFTVSNNGELDAIRANVATLSSGLLTESQTRIDNDAAINLRIDGMEANAAVAEGNTTVLEGRLDDLSDGLADEITARTDADTLLTDQMSTLSDAVTAAVAQSDAVALDLEQEAVTRQSADDTLQDQIDNLTGTYAGSLSDLQNAIVAEASARLTGDTNVTSAMTALVTSTVANEASLRSNRDDDLQAQIAAMVQSIHSYYQSTEPALSPDSPNPATQLVSDANEGDLWFDNSGKLVLKRFHKGHVANGIATQGTWDAMALGVTTYYQSSAPTAPGAGDLWIDNSSGQNVIKRYNGSGFDTISVSGNFVSKTGDTMTGDLTMNADMDVTAGNTLFIGGSDGAISYNTSGTYGGSNVLISVNNRNLALDATGNIFLNPKGVSSYFYIGTAVAQRFSVDASGNVQAQGDIGGMSDASVKRNVTTIENALDKLDALRGVTFDRIDMAGAPRGMGVIAQEVAPVAPELVKTAEDGKLWVAYGNFAGLFIEAIKELRAELNEIKKKLP